MYVKYVGFTICLLLFLVYTWCCLCTLFLDRVWIAFDFVGTRWFRTKYGWGALRFSLETHQLFASISCFLAQYNYKSHSHFITWRSLVILNTWVFDSHNSHTYTQSRNRRPIFCVCSPAVSFLLYSRFRLSLLQQVFRPLEWLAFQTEYETPISFLSLSLFAVFRLIRLKLELSSPLLRSTIWPFFRRTGLASSELSKTIS